MKPVSGIRPVPHALNADAFSHWAQPEHTHGRQGFVLETALIMSVSVQWVKFTVDPNPKLQNRPSFPANEK